MAVFLQSIEDALVEMSSEELIAGVMIALALSLILSGLYALWRRKMADTLTLTTLLMLVACTLSMALGAGYVRYTRKIGRTRVGRAGFPPHLPFPQVEPVGYLARRIIDAADSDRDGLLSHEEAALGVALFMKEADTSGKGSIDALTLDRLLWRRVGTNPPNPDPRPWPERIPHQER